MWLRDGEWPNCWDINRDEWLYLIQLEHDVLYRQYILLLRYWLLSSRPCVWYYRPVHNIFIFVATLTLLDIAKANQNPCSTLLVEGEFFFIFLHWTGGVMFGNSHFGNAQSPCNGLHCPSFLGKFGLEHDKVPLGIRLVNVQYQCGMCRITPCIIQGLLHACFFGPRFWARNGVFHFVGSMWVAFNTR